MATKTIDLQTRIDEINDELEDIEDKARQFNDGQRVDIYEDETEESNPLDYEEAFEDLCKAEDNPGEAPEHLETLVERTTDALTTYEELKQQHQELTHAKEQIEEKIEVWEGSEFKIRKFMWGEQQRVQDLARSDALQADDMDHRAQLGGYQIRTVQVGTVSTPPEAPDNPKSWPAPIGTFVNDAIESYNSTGDPAGNRTTGQESQTSSLEQALSDGKS